MGNEVLVTGAAGFVGRHIATACAMAGWRVSTLDIRPAPDEVLERTGFRRCDHADPEVLGAIRDGRYVAVFHQAGISSTLANDWSMLERTNVAAPLVLAAACADAGTRFLYASSHSVYGRISARVAVAEDADLELCSGPLNLYARSKYLLDRTMAAEFPDRLEWIGMRYTNVFGRGERHKGTMASVISQLLHQAAGCAELRLFAGTLEACRDYIPVDAVAETCVRLIEAPVPSGVYNLGSGHATSFRTLVQWCAEFAGIPVLLRLVPNPVKEQYQFWTCADMGKLHAALPDRPVTTAGDIRCAAESLFREFQTSS